MLKRSLSVFLLIPVMAYSQTFQIDSLENISKTLKGTEQVDVLNQIAFELLSYDNKRVNAVALNAYQLSEKINYVKGKAQSLIYLAETQSSLGNKDSSIKSLKESITLSKKNDLRGLQGYGLTYLGSNYVKSNHLDSALFNYDEAYALLKDEAEPYYLSFLYLHLAEYYKLKNETTKQLEYLQKCWFIREQWHEKKYLIWIGDLLAAFYIEQGDYDKAESYLNRAQKTLGKDTIDNEEISFIYRQRAIIYINLGYSTKAYDLLVKVKKYFERVANQFELVNTDSEIGYVFMDIANYEMSLKNYFSALTRAEKFQYEFERAELLFRIAWVYYQLKQNKSAEEFIKKSLALAHENHQKSEEGSALNLLGLIADRQNKNEDAMNYYTEALSIRKSINSLNGIASTMLNIGILLEKQGKLKEALEFDLNSKAIEESTGHRLGMAYTYQSLGQLYTKLKDYKMSDTYLTKAETVGKEIKAGNILLDILKNRRDLLLAQQKYHEASEYGIYYDALKDSIFSLNLSDRISNLQNIFQLEQKQNIITILSQQQELQKRKIQIQEAQLSRQKGIIIIGIISVVTMLIVIYVIYRYYTKVKVLNGQLEDRSEEIRSQAEELANANEFLTKLNNETVEQKEEIQAQAEELTESNNLILSINETLEDRIAERTSELKQAYKELDTFFYRSSHDFRRPLTTFMGLAEVAKIALQDKVALDLFEKVNETAHNLDKMLQKLQSISDLGVQELVLKEIYFEEFLRHECSLFDPILIQKNIQLEISVDQKLTFLSYPVLVRIILNNLIENAISFCSSEAPFIWFKAGYVENKVLIEIKDNGCGIRPEYLSRVFEMYFRANENSKGNGLGLYIVKKAVDKLKGNILIESEFAKGTKISIWLPKQMDELIR